MAALEERVAILERCDGYRANLLRWIKSEKSKGNAVFYTEDGVLYELSSLGDFERKLDEGLGGGGWLIVGLDWVNEYPPEAEGPEDFVGRSVTAKAISHYIGATGDPHERECQWGIFSLAHKGETR